MLLFVRREVRVRNGRIKLGLNGVDLRLLAGRKRQHLPEQAEALNGCVVGRNGHGFDLLQSFVYSVKARYYRYK